MNLLSVFSEIYPDDFDSFRLFCMITVIAKRCGKDEISKNAEWLAGTILEARLEGMLKSGQ